MPFEPLQIDRLRQNIVSIDKYGRIRLSKAALIELKLSAYQYVVVSVDVDLKRIGLAKQELAKAANATPVKVDRRGYATRIGREIARKLALKLDDAPFRFEYIGFVDDGGVRWLAYELVK